MEKRKILLVDDNADIRFTVAEICRAANLEVVACADYWEVEQNLGRKDIELFLVDYHLPKKDGAEVVRMIRKTNKTVPIIMLTVEGSSAVAEKVKAAGANDYAMKPVRALDLISRIRVHLQHKDAVQYYTDYNSKGVNQATLEKICEAMRESKDYVEIKTIAEKTGIGDKSIYRYLKHMMQEGMVDVQYRYEKQGRPRSSYKLK